MKNMYRFEGVQKRKNDDKTGIQNTSEGKLAELQINSQVVM